MAVREIYDSNRVLISAFGREKSTSLVLNIFANDLSLLSEVHLSST